MYLFSVANIRKYCKHCTRNLYKSSQLLLARFSSRSCNERSWICFISKYGTPASRLVVRSEGRLSRWPRCPLVSHQCNGLYTHTSSGYIPLFSLFRSSSLSVLSYNLATCCESTLQLFRHTQQSFLLFKKSLAIITGTIRFCPWEKILWFLSDIIKIMWSSCYCINI